MVTLYNRASAPQHRMLRAIEGAVINAAHAHPEFKIDRRFAKSVAKRATGTLTASWPEVLAATTPSGKSVRAQITQHARHQPAQLRKRTGRGASEPGYGAPLFRKLHSRISRLVRPAKIEGRTERVEALIECLRIVANLRDAEAGKSP